jgi:flavin-dependent dehydrogenase
VVEALVVGAGPAGSVAACLLARAGVRVWLVDRARFPRPKPCGDTLNPGALRILRRLDLADRIEPLSLVLEGMVVTGEHGAAVRAAYPRGLRAWSVPRQDLDAALVSAAVEAGARFEEGILVRRALVAEGRRGPEVRGVVLAGRDGRSIRLPACLTIAADGRRSRLAVGLGLARQPSHPRRWAVGAYFTGVTGLSSYGEMHIRARRYFGVAPLADGRANACVVTGDVDGFADPAAVFRTALSAEPLLADRFARASPASPIYSVGPLALDVSSHGLPGLLLAGDAAGFVDPMTGDGIRLALRGAELAAAAAIEALDRGSTDAWIALAGWRHGELARKQRFNRLLRFAVGSPIGVRAASLGARLAPALVRGLVTAAGDVRV